MLFSCHNTFLAGPGDLCRWIIDRLISKWQCGLMVFIGRLNDLFRWVRIQFTFWLTASCPWYMVLVSLYNGGPS